MVQTITEASTTIELEAGIYTLDFLGINSTDENDLFVLESDSTIYSNFFGQWEELDIGTEIRLGELTNLVGEPITIAIAGGITITARTDDTYEYPNDDTPTNPTVDIGFTDISFNTFEAPLDEVDGIGTVIEKSNRSELRTDNGEVETTVMNDFFANVEDLTDYGDTGSAGLWVSNPGINKVTFNMKGDYEWSTLLFWNGEEFHEIDNFYLTNSTIDIYVDAIADEWGFALIDLTDPNNPTKNFDTDFRISNIEFVGIEDNILNGDWRADISGLTPTDSIGNVRIIDNDFTLSTGSSDRAISSLGTFTAGDRNFLSSLGTEGSAATIENLESGTYSFDWSLYSKDTSGNDALYVWNGKDLTLIGDRSDANQISTARWTIDPTVAEVDVIYDYLTFIAVDEVDKRGTSDFTIDNLERTGDLDYAPPEVIDFFNTGESVGDINIKDAYLGVATGSGDRAISTLNRDLTPSNDSLLGLGTEGSYVTYDNLTAGVYEITWSIYTGENDTDRDRFVAVVEEEVYDFAERSFATNYNSRTTEVSDRFTSQIHLTGDTGFSLGAIDTVDKSGTSELRIFGMERIDIAISSDVIVHGEGVPV